MALPWCVSPPAIPDIKAMFDPRPPIPMVKPPVKKKKDTLNGLAGLTGLFETGPAPPREKTEIPKERKVNIGEGEAGCWGQEGRLAFSHKEPQPWCGGMVDWSDRCRPAFVRLV